MQSDHVYCNISLSRTCGHRFIALCNFWGFIRLFLFVDRRGVASVTKLLFQLAEDVIMRTEEEAPWT